MCFGRLLSLALIVALSLGDTLALARQSDASDIEAARRAYWEGRFEDSIKVLEPLLDDLSDAAALREAAFLLGLNYLALGEAARGQVHFKSAVTYDPYFVPSEEVHPPDVVETYRAVRAEMVGKLAVETDPPGAQILVAGQPAGETPYEGEALAGDQTIRVELTGYAAEEQQVTLSAGETTTIRFALRRETAKADRTPSKANKPPEEFGKIKLLTSQGDKTKEKDAILVLDNDRLVVRDRKGGAEMKTLSYSDIQTAEYSYSKHPRWKEGIGVAIAVGVFAAPLFFMKGKKHWLTLQTEDDYAILRLDKKNHDLVRLAFESRSGIRVDTVGEK
jgi:hypothetical protein